MAKLLNLVHEQSQPLPDNEVKMVGHMTKEEFDELYPRKKEAFYKPNYGFGKFRIGQR